MNCSPPGSSVHGILQARILELVTISFSRGSSWPSQPGTPLTKAGVAATAAWCSGCHEQRLMLGLLYGTILWGDELTIWWQVDYIGPLLVWKGQWFMIILDTYSWCGFAFPTCRTLASVINQELAEYLFYEPRSPTKHYGKSVNSRYLKHRKGLMTTGFTGPIPYSTLRSFWEESRIAFWKYS